MSRPICIHCGAEDPYVTQVISMTETRYLQYEEEFHVRTNQCGCRETCEGCDDPDDNQVWVYDGGDGQYSVNPDRGEYFRGTHPVYDYEEDPDNISCNETDMETTDVEFITNCCHIRRSHIRELVRMEDGPAYFDDGSESQYSGTVQSAVTSVQNVGVDESGMLVLKDGPAPSEMDMVLASIEDLP